MIRKISFVIITLLAMGFFTITLAKTVTCNSDGDCFSASSIDRKTKPRIIDDVKSQFKDAGTLVKKQHGLCFDTAHNTLNNFAEFFDSGDVLMLTKKQHKVCFKVASDTTSNFGDFFKKSFNRWWR